MKAMTMAIPKVYTTTTNQEYGNHTKPTSSPPGDQKTCHECLPPDTDASSQMGRYNRPTYYRHPQVPGKAQWQRHLQKGAM